jgi:hypothetical protein
MPDTLEQYDAIFTDLRFFKGIDDSFFIAKELQKLSNFLIAKGKLYIEIAQNTIYEWGPKIYSEYPLFRDLSGSIEFTAWALSVQTPDKIIGVKGSFTEEINLLRNNEEWQLVGYMGVDGTDLGIILKTNTINDLAWGYEKENRKVVYHDPFVTEHYALFLDMVICNYFELCQPLAVEPTTDITAPSLTYAIETREIKYQNATSSHRPITISVYNLLGAKVFEAKADGNTLVLPESLSAGCYIIKALEDGNVNPVEKKIVVY